MSDRVKLYRDDCLAVLPTLAAGSADAVVTDPPYGLEFMGKEWDSLRNKWEAPAGRYHNDTTFLARGDRIRYKAGPEMQQWHQQWAAACLRVLKPGGYLMAFGGTRTFHRLACALEDAGFEMRDTLCWLYGSGFPKGKGCLKPAWEPVLLCRRPGPRVLPLGIEECRVPCEGGSPAADRRKGKSPGRPGEYGHTIVNRITPERYAEERPGEATGRYPANVAHDGSAEVQEAFAAAGERKSGSGKRRPREWQSQNCYGFSQSVNGASDYEREGDTGTAARFFYCAKASRRERNAGLEGMPERPVQEHGSITGDGSTFVAPDGTVHSRGKSRPSANHHPCVKPLALMEWLVKLACPPGGLVLDPFLGSGTTLVACVRTGRRGVGVESDPGYLEIARRRIAAARPEPTLFPEPA